MKVLLVVADSVRADALDASPLGAFAAEGTCFPQARAGAPWTVPAVGALLTGTWAHRLGLVKWEQPYPAQHPTLFHRLEEAGIPVASFPFDPAHLFVHAPEARVVGSSQDRDPMLAFLQEQRGKPGLVLVHHWWTHLPYLDRHLPLGPWNQLCRGLLSTLAAPDPALRLRNRDRLEGLYRLAVERLGQTHLPDLVDAARPDLTVVLADHGESWGERMEPGTYPRDVFDLHGNHLHDEVLRIPWILHGPGVVPRARVEGPARGVDLLPTLLDLMGLPPVACDGRSLVPWLEGAIPDDVPSYAFRNRDFVDLPSLPQSPEQVFVEASVVRDQVKVLRQVDGTRARRFDLRADPGETRALPPDPSLLADLDAAWDQAVVGSHGEEDYARMRSRMRALGYLS